VIRARGKPDPLAGHATFTTYRDHRNKVISVRARCGHCAWSNESVTRPICRELTANHLGISHGIVIQVSTGPAAPRVPGQNSAAVPLGQLEMRRAQRDGATAVAQLLQRRYVGPGVLRQHLTVRR
jgi:hypothetical protein